MNVPFELRSGLVLSYYSKSRLTRSSAGYYCLVAIPLPIVFSYDFLKVLYPQIYTFSDVRHLFCNSKSFLSVQSENSFERKVAFMVKNLMK